MPSQLPDRPSLNQLKVQAKELLSKIRSNDPSAKLAHAQNLLARQYGFPDWQALLSHVNAVTGLRLKQLSETFRQFASLECRGRSASYECWANHIADDHDLLRVAAFGRAPIPNLLFAAVHLLVLANPACDLARHYASVDRNPLSPELGWTHFRDFCLSNRQSVVRLMKARTTQTNEVRRSAYLAAAFNIVWKLGGQKQLALVEIGTSAGLNLCFDQYAFRMGGETFGNAQSSLVLDVEVRGQLIPPFPRQSVPIVQRIGIDIHPITAEDAEGIEWLNALVWPEHHDRRTELNAALQIAANIPRQMIAGDAATVFDSVLRGLSDDCTVCVFQTHSFNQIPAQGRDDLVKTMKRFAEIRPLYFVSRHNSLTLNRFGSAIEPSLWSLAETDPHGRWIEWHASIM